MKKKNSAFIPPDKKEVESIYEQKAPLYNQLIEEICYIIDNNLKKEKIEFSNIEFRLKLFNSFYEKVLRKEFDGDLFEQIEDIAGVRILCPYRSCLEQIESLIKDRFDVIKAEINRNRSDLLFGYMSDHYIVRLPAKYRGERYDSIKSLKCEIQVRTVAMHAWTTVSHQLDYKQDIDIPSQLKNDFYALSGVFYIADSLFEQFRKSHEESKKKLTKSIQQRGFNLKNEINLDTMEAYISRKFPNRVVGNKESISMLLSEGKLKGITDFRKLDGIIEANLEWLIQDEKVDPPTDSSGKKTKYSGVGIVRVIVRHKG